ncbi:Phospholipase A1 [Melia azedarach]|uniref:Phospholipase A1 n=1 Tax=Melia azedarach TaxID=155640 RepID=A0ACC1X098_MELAZ|nr:Phospholipase A1 [Melia azedarach]
MDISNPINGTGKACPVTAIVFASPRVGDEGLKRVYSTLDDLHILRITNIRDKVPDLLRTFTWYIDVGKELKIDSKKSPCLKGNAFSHDIELYLHTVAGTQGINRGLKLVVPRCVSLLNKDTDALKDEYNAPVEWWCEKNKSMVQRNDGSWELDDHGYAPIPPSPR